MFSDDPNPNEKYLSAIKNSVPSIFKEFFGRYNPSVSSSDMDLLVAENVMTTPSSYYLYSNLPTTTQLLTTTTSYGLRDRLKNKTITKIKSFRGYFYQRDDLLATIISILENLPIYATLSFLLMRYGMLFCGCLATKISDLYNKPKLKRENLSSPADNKSVTIHINDTNSEANTAVNSEANTTGNSEANSEINSETTSQADESQSHDKKHHSRNIAKQLGRLFDNKHASHSKKNKFTKENVDEILHSINEGYKEQNHFKITEELESKDNHNYMYIKNLFGEFCFHDISDRELAERVKKREGFKSKLQRSFLYGLFEERIYKPVPYMKYSKQFVNTYTVGKIIYVFFTM